MFIHTPETRHRQPTPFFELRALSILLGLATLIVAHLVAARLYPQNRVIPLLAMTLVAGWPQFLFISRAISNDTMATAVAVLVLLVLTDVGKPRRFYLAALLTVLAFLTKLSVAFTVGVVLLVWVAEYASSGEKKRPYLRALSGMVAIWFLAILLVNLSPPLRLGLQQSVDDFAGLHWGVNSLAYWQQVYVWTINSGWAWFGWLTVAPADWHAQLWWLFIEIASIVGAYVTLKRSRGTNARIRLLVLTCWWVATIASYMRVTANRWQPQFRLALSVLPVLASFTAIAVIWPLRQKRHYQWIAWGVFLAGLFAYNLWLIFALILPTYS
jgi:dolichyl-phosphate-mannose--protein O-mannosyl transferase